MLLLAMLSVRCLTVLSLECRFKARQWVSLACGLTQDRVFVLPLCVSCCCSIVVLGGFAGPFITVSSQTPPWLS